MTETSLIVPLDQVDRVAHVHHTQLSELLRYDRYRVLDEESPELWVSMLGPDVLSLTHPAVTAAICLRFADYNERNGIRLTQEEQIIFFTTPWIHDWGELKVDGFGVGDVSYSLRTDADEKIEAQVFHMVASTIGDMQARALFTEAYDTVAMDRTTKLGRMFNAVEQIGYLATAIRTYEGQSNQRIRNWSALCGNVLAHQIEKLLLYAQEYPYVGKVLQDHASVIDAMFEDVGKQPIGIDREDRPFYDAEKFRTAREAWERKDDSVLVFTRDPAMI